VQVSTLQGEPVWNGDENRQKDQNKRSLSHEIRWDGVNSASGTPRVVASGVYVYTIITAEGQVLRRDKIAVVH
jgi:hypothetical protein